MVRAGHDAATAVHQLSVFNAANAMQPPRLLHRMSLPSATASVQAPGQALQPFITPRCAIALYLPRPAPPPPAHLGRQRLGLQPLQPLQILLVPPPLVVVLRGAKQGILCLFNSLMYFCTFIYLCNGPVAERKKLRQRDAKHIVCRSRAGARYCLPAAEGQE